jgi:two-component system sensor kinase FixL
VTDWKIEFNATLGFLYMFPLVLLGTVCGWWQLVLAALFCTFLSDRLDPFPLEMQIPRDMLIFITLATTGLLSRDVAKGYRREMESLSRVEKEVIARRAAEEQLEFLIQSSPAAVLTMTAEGEILLANPAAHRLFGVPGSTLPGRRIARYIPALGSVPSIDDTAKIFRTEMQTRGQRESGDVFLADVFFSTYSNPAGPRLAALHVRMRVFNNSWQVRESWWPLYRTRSEMFAARFA